MPSRASRSAPVSYQLALCTAASSRGPSSRATVVSARTSRSARAIRIAPSSALIMSVSRVPAEQGALVAMLAGDDAVAAVRPVLAPMCRETFDCGGVPGALLMKFSVNLFLITLVTGLTEAFHFAGRHGLDQRLLRDVLDAGPMASAVSRVKGPKLLARDFAVQAGAADVLKNNRLIAEAARKAEVASPLLDVCHALYGETVAQGHGGEDMVAVLHALETRTEGSAVPGSPDSSADPRPTVDNTTP